VKVELARVSAFVKTTADNSAGNDIGLLLDCEVVGMGHWRCAANAVRMNHLLKNPDFQLAT
jgi:hypothetical protein